MSVDSASDLDWRREEGREAAPTRNQNSLYWGREGGGEGREKSVGHKNNTGHMQPLA